MNQSQSFIRKPIPIIRNPKNITFNTSSSSDELPELNTAQINDNQDNIQFESESEYESYSYEAEEINWKSNKSSNHKVHPPITKTSTFVRRPIQRGQNTINQRGRRPIPKPKQQEKIQNEQQSEKRKSNINQIQTKNLQVQQEKEENQDSSKEEEEELHNNEEQENQTQTQETEIPQQEETEIELSNQQDLHSMDSISLSTSETNQCNTMPNLLNNQPQVTEENHTNSSNSNGIYQIVYQSINMRRRKVSMFFDERLVYYSQPYKDKVYGSVNIISTKNNTIDTNSPNCIGMIMRNRKNSRFLVIGKSDGTNPPPQIVGIHFSKLSGEYSNFRHFKIAIPTNEMFYNANDKVNDLSKIAKRGEDFPDVQIFHTLLPKKNSDGKYILQYYAPFYSKKSPKNFAIRDNDDEETLFLICQVSFGFCKLIRKDPITPLISFAIAVSILTTKK